MTDNTGWAEDLPPNCPPADAIEPVNDPFYRLVGNVPPSDEDFWSQRKLYPLKKFNTTECMACSCSLSSTIDRCVELSKLPALQNKRIVELLLPPKSGLIKKTGVNADHFSWWRAKDFDPIPICIEVSVQLNE
jgi:hypothetical protein